MRPRAAPHSDPEVARSEDELNPREVLRYEFVREPKSPESVIRCGAYSESKRIGVPRVGSEGRGGIVSKASRQQHSGELPVLRSDVYAVRTNSTGHLNRDSI